LFADPGDECRGGVDVCEPVSYDLLGDPFQFNFIPAATTHIYVLLDGRPHCPFKFTVDEGTYYFNNFLTIH
jgi:hypothetical protein